MSNTGIINWVNQETRFIGMAHHDSHIALAQLEFAGRLAWKSEKQEDDTASKFVNRIVSKGHGSVLEHSNIVLEFDSDFNNLIKHSVDSKYLHIQTRENGNLSVSGSLRAWLERNPKIYEVKEILNSLYPTLFTPPPTPKKPGPDIHVTSVPIQDQEGEECSLMFHVITDRGITHEIVRHRTLQFTQESTRYVNYDKKGFSMIFPVEAEPDSRNGILYQRLLTTVAKQATYNYNDALRLGLQPQIARDILPHFTKTEIIISGRPSAWRHFYSLRSAQGAHPRIREIAKSVGDTLRDLGHLRY